ncbi:MAG: hypothetical protein ABSC95_11490 [Acetobacteraceae bacterium]|jgi:hypothetical protein
MPAAGQLGQVADRLGSLGGLAERHFDAIGHSLEQAVGILAALTASFQALLGDLRGSELAQSGQDLAAVAARVGMLSGAAQADVATLRHLAGIAEAIDGRIARMHIVLREVDILAMNARLVAASMGAAGTGFLPFAAEIRRSAGAARDGLDRLATELAGARQHLQAAGQAAGAFVGRHAGTMQAIIGRLAASVASIEAHVRLSGNAASVVAARSEEIHGQVAAAIVALQLGDITRQRIEHMQSACQLLSQAAAPPALACRLVAAHLLDVAEELERGAARIVQELHGLAAEAGDIARQGNQTYGASGRAAGSFLDELEADAQQAQALFGDLRAAHATVNPRIAAVLQAADGLVGHVATIRSVEADIHIMGINTSLKCGRLGVVGRPLSVISQAVRDCGRQTAQHAAGVLDALQGLLADAGTLAEVGAATGADAIDAAAQRMTEAVRRLGGTAERMGAALIGLAVDGEAVARLLHTAVEGFAVQHEIGAVLREAATACHRQAGQATDEPIPDAVLAHIAAGYTMARERTVHARFAPLQGVPPTDEPVAATEAEAFADVLF